MPHPRLRERWFALAPLLDVAPDLAPEFGPWLTRADGPPPAGACIEAPHVRVQASGRECSVEVTGGLDTADACAAALAALGAAACGRGCGASQVRVLRGGCTPGLELQALASRALALAASGFAFSRATLCELGPGRFDARLIGSAGAPAPRCAGASVVACVSQPGCVQLAAVLAE